MVDEIILFSDPDCPQPHRLQECSIDPFPCLPPANLREVHLNNMEVLESRDDEYPNTQCSNRELPAHKCLIYRYSESLVKQIITSSPKFSMVVVDWSKLCVLKLCPQEKEGMVCLQPILDAVCNTLEELYLTNRGRGIGGKMWSFLSI